MAHEQFFLQRNNFYSTFLKKCPKTGQSRPAFGASFVHKSQVQSLAIFFSQCAPRHSTLVARLGPVTTRYAQTCHRLFLRLARRLIEPPNAALSLSATNYLFRKINYSSTPLPLKVISKNKPSPIKPQRSARGIHEKARTCLQGGSVKLKTPLPFPLPFIPSHFKKKHHFCKTFWFFLMFFLKGCFFFIHSQIIGY